MKYLAILMLLLLIVAAVGCKKKKELTAWARYQAGAESSIALLRQLENYKLGNENLDKFKQDLKKTEGEINQFLQLSKDETEKLSRVEIEAALQDFQVSAELAERKKANASEQFFADKL